MEGGPLQLPGLDGRTTSYGRNGRRVGVKKIPAVATTAGGKNGPVGPRVTLGGTRRDFGQASAVAGLLANPLGSSYVVRTTDRAGVMLDVELRLAVQTDVGERFRGRQPCRAFGPIQDTHRDHTNR